MSTESLHDKISQDNNSRYKDKMIKSPDINKENSTTYISNINTTINKSSNSPNKNIMQISSTYNNSKKTIDSSLIDASDIELNTNPNTHCQTLYKKKTYDSESFSDEEDAFNTPNNNSNNKHDNNQKIELHYTKNISTNQPYERINFASSGTSSIIKTAPQINKTIIFLGESFTGKTSILLRFSKKKFRKDNKYLETLGVNYYNKENMTEFGNVIYNLWDTNGMESKLQILPSTIYQKADSYFIVLSYDLYKSYESLENLINYICEKKNFDPSRNSYNYNNNFEDNFYNDDNNNNNNFEYRYNDKLPIFILINKCDLENKDKKFKKEMVIKILNKLEDDDYYRYIKFYLFEVSAAKNIHVDYAFYTLTMQLFGIDNTNNNNSDNLLNLTFDTLVNPRRKSFKLQQGKLNGKNKKNNKARCCK